MEVENIVQNSMTMIDLGFILSIQLHACHGRHSVILIWALSNTGGELKLQTCSLCMLSTLRDSYLLSQILIGEQDTYPILVENNTLHMPFTLAQKRKKQIDRSIKGLNKMYTHSLIHSHAFVMYIMSSSSFLFYFLDV